MKFDSGLGWATVIWFVLFSLHYSAHAKTHACRDDFKTYCSEIAQGDGRLTSCMLTNKGKFSEACQAEIARQQEERNSLYKEFYSKCETAIDTLCKGVTKGDGKILKCVGEKIKRAPASEAELIKPDCRKTVVALRKRRSSR